MYSGYRVKINGKILKNNMIAKGTYSCVEGKRISDTWEDLNLIEHEYVLENTKTQISFSIREHRLSEHEDVISCFTAMNDVTVEYWSDTSMTYKTGVFNIEEITYSHSDAFDDEIFYKATKVTMIER